MNASPIPWNGKDSSLQSIQKPDNAKKNVFIIADPKLTVLFDMIAPFYLFNATEKANVYIISKEHKHILIKQGLFVSPQLTFNEADSMKLFADVIVIPALSIRDTNQDPQVISWIKNHFSAETRLMAVCDGASTAAATGLFDGKTITCHASVMDDLKELFPKPIWVRNVPVTKSGNLFSTAGVSNAVEGSLTVINELFGEETMRKVLTTIHYPANEIKTSHQSVAVNGHDKWTAAKKIFFRKNRKLGLILNDGVDEFNLASVLETYSRTLPAKFIVFTHGQNNIVSSYGLRFLISNHASLDDIDELHVLQSGDLTGADDIRFNHTRKIRYDSFKGDYPINICLERINKLYGDQFTNLVKKSLDYN